MQPLFSSPYGALVHLVRGALQHHGIECVVRGEHLASVAGAVPPTDAWVELWVVDGYRTEEARSLLDEMFREETREEGTWLCPDCLEWIEEQFSNCWNCGADRVS